MGNFKGWLVGMMAAGLSSAAMAGMTVTDRVAQGETLLLGDSQSGLDWLSLSLTAGQSLDQVRAGDWLTQGFRLATQQELTNLLTHVSAPFLEVLGSVPAPDAVSAYMGGPTTMLQGLVAGDSEVGAATVPAWTVYLTTVSGSTLTVGDLGPYLSGPYLPGPYGSRSQSLSPYSSGAISISSVFEVSPATEPLTGSVDAGAIYPSGMYVRYTSAPQSTGESVDGVGVFLVREVSPVPEPATWALFGLGLLGFAVVSARRR